jgi:hypothetical protein
VTYPVLVLGHNSNDELKVYRDEAAFHTCSEAALREGWYNGLEVVDSDGSLFRVEAAHFKGAGKKAWPSLFAPRLVQVDLVIGPREQLDLATMKDLVATRIRSNRGSFEAVYVDVDHVLREISGASSAAEILHALTRLGLAAPAPRRR